jgi:hypothetical protein
MWPGIAWFLPGATGRLAHADRADAAMEHGAVGGGAAGDAEAAHDTLEAFALRDADDIDELAFGESGDVYDVADLERRGRVEADFREDARGVFEAGLLRVAEFGGAGVLLLLRREADLDGVIAIGFGGLHLHDRAGAGFDHGDGHEHILCVVNLRHPDFLTEER